MSEYLAIVPSHAVTGGSKPSLNYTGSETAANLNSSNAKSVTVKAKWTPYTKDFSYTGSAQTWTALYSGYYKIELWGASGGDISSQLGGYGGYTSGHILFNKNQSIYVYVGATTSTVNGGWNGGGSILNNNASSRGGGGASDIRVTTGNWNDADSLRSRIMVAGGGGGSFTSASGGTAGGLTGGSGIHVPLSGYETTPSTGGSQTSGGSITGTLNTDGCGISYCVTDHIAASFGLGGSGYWNSEGLGAGGSGWYGGETGNGRGNNGSGAGGSSYISGHTGSVGVTSTTDSSPKSGCATGTTNNACSVTPYINPATNAGYTFTNTVMIDGAGYSWTNVKGALQQMPNPSGGYYASGVGHSGSGYARIIYLGTSI